MSAFLFEVFRNESDFLLKASTTNILICLSEEGGTRWFMMLKFVARFIFSDDVCRVSDLEMCKLKCGAVASISEVILKTSGKILSVFK